MDKNKTLSEALEDVNKAFFSLWIEIKKAFCFDKKPKTKESLVLVGIGTQAENCTILNVYNGEYKKGFIDIDGFEVDAEYKITIEKGTK